jgi:23S rRNA pseudouridine1911/1915/1917 synthase
MDCMGKRRLDFVIPPEYNGRKVVHFLRGPAQCSYTLVRSLKTLEDGILLNGAHIRTIDRLHTGDRLSITICDAPQVFEPCETPVEILYEDSDVIVYNKPAAMACHPVRGLRQGTLANVFARDCAARGENCACRLVGRLDCDTSGAVVIAKNAHAAAVLTGHIEKQYIALVTGAPNPICGVIDAPIGQPDRMNPRRTVTADGKPAVTEYETQIRCGEYSVVRCVLRTGRTHQIRVHMSSIGCPLLGDALYGGETERIERQALHCMQASFIHPVDKRLCIVRAPIPKDMQKLMPRNQQT